MKKGLAWRFTLAVTIMAVGAYVIMTAPGFASAGLHKVVVCKYVGTPGVNERLQTGGNPIVVDYHSLGAGFTGTFPYAFNDAQGRSIAVQYTDDVHFSDLSVCPAPDGPPPCEVDCGPPPTGDPSLSVAVECVGLDEQMDVTLSADGADAVEFFDPPTQTWLPADLPVTHFTNVTTVTFRFTYGESFVKLTANGDPLNCETTPPGGGGGGNGGGGGGKNPHPVVPPSPTLKQYTQDVKHGAEPGGG